MFLLCAVFAAFVHRVMQSRRLSTAVKLLELAPNAAPRFNAVGLPSAAPRLYAASLVRTVNCLQSLGKDDAIEALRLFLAQHPLGSDNVGDHQCLEIVVPLLFKRRNEHDRLPMPVDVHGEYKLVHTEWPIWVSTESDLPFDIVPASEQEYRPIDRTYLINWADQRGVLRARPMRPTDDIAAAAESLMEKLISSDGSHIDDDSTLANYIRLQAMFCILHCWDTKYIEVDGSDIDQWRAFKVDCKRLKIKWNTTTQMYETTYSTSLRLDGPQARIRQKPAPCERANAARHRSSCASVTTVPHVVRRPQELADQRTTRMETGAEGGRGKTDGAG